MKTIILKSVFFGILSAGVLTGCVNDEYDTPNLAGCTETTLVKNREVSEISAAAIVAQHQNIVPGVSDIIEAYVTSSDVGGNFFKSISFQTLDGSKAFSVPIDATSTFINYEPGRKVMIKMDGLYTDIKDGGMRIGGLYANSSGGAEVGRLTEVQSKGSLSRSCTLVSEDDLVQHVSLTAVQNDKYLNKLIELDNVQFDNNAIVTTYYDKNNDLGGATNHNLNDLFGNTIVFRTSSFANFSAKPVATGSGKVRGVLTKFGTTYQFMVRSENDIKLTNARFALIPAFYTEDFQTAIDNTNLNLTNWTNVATTGTRLWREEVFSGNGYAEFSAFGSGQALNTVWLVTPAIDFTAYTTKQIEFQVAQHHLDLDTPNNSLEVLISTDFAGNVATATWTSLTANATIPVKATAWYTFLKSSIDVSAYSGSNVRVAFKFIGSGTDTQLDGAFQIDNFKAYGN